MVFDSSLEHQHSTLKKFSRRWFGPYVVVATHDNATYSLRELDGTMLKSLLLANGSKHSRGETEDFILMILQPLACKRTMKWKKQIQSQVKMGTCRITKKIETWHIPEDVQV